MSSDYKMILSTEKEKVEIRYRTKNDLHWKRLEVIGSTSDELIEKFLKHLEVK